MMARMGIELLQLWRPSVKMGCCCEGAAGAMGRSSGAGCGVVESVAVPLVGTS